MSVQAGIWNFDGRPVDHKLLADFSESMKHQGPDGDSSHVAGSIALLYRPFHTTAESRREKQPYLSRKGFILTWDGRLDNRDQLLAALDDDVETEPTDVAIVAAAFDRWGNKCFRLVLGDWAVSVWMPEPRELVFATDYMGIRHIFYYITNNRILWSTDLTPLILLSGDNFHVDDDYIAGYLALDPAAHRTPYLEIRQAPPGQFVRIRDGRASVTRFWTFNPKSRIRYKTDGEYEEHFRHVFCQSVRRRLRSDFPILAELSGGLDSSSIICVADNILAKQEAQVPRLDTLSYFDKTESHGDDWSYLQRIEEKRGRVGAHIDASKLGSDPASLQYSDFKPLPGYNGSGRYLETERAGVVRGGGYRVLLSGVGGDEFMGGIPNPNAQLGDLIVQFKFVKLAQELVAWGLVKRRPWAHLLWQACIDLLPSYLRQHFSKQARVEPWIDKGFAKRTRLAMYLLDADDHFGLLLPTRRSCIAGVLLMANKLAKCTSRALPLEEVRYPYLDQDLIEFILSIPATQLLRPGERRSLMCRALVGIVPPEILTRRTKQFGARTPVVALRKNWDELNRVFSSPLSSKLGYVDHTSFLQQLCEATHGKELHILRSLKTISLELWLRDLASRHLLNGISFPPTGVGGIGLRSNG